MKRSSLITAAAFIGTGIALSLPLLAFADDQFVPLTQLPGLSSISSLTATSVTLPGFINTLYKICIGLAAFFAIVQIAWAGYLFMSSADSISKNTKARQKIMNAVIGLLLVLSPFIVFSVINPSILNISLNFADLKSNNGTGAPVNLNSTDSATAAVQQNICAPYQASGGKLAYSTLVGSQTCSSVNGTGWAAVPGCCANTPDGQTCCGYDPLNNQTVTSTANLNGPASFSISYQDTAYLKSTDTKQSACLATDDQSFPNQQACVTAYNNVTAAAKGTIAVGKLCTESSAHSLTPASAAAQLQKLPSCPAQ